MTVPAHRGRRDNGLDSAAFSPLADVDPRLGDHLLDVLGLKEIPAYVEPAPFSTPVTADRLFVASHQTIQAQGVLNQLANELGIQIARNGHQPALRRRDNDLLEGVDTDAEFAAIVASMPELARPLADSPGAAYYLPDSGDSTPSALESVHRDPSAAPAEPESGAGLPDDVVEHFSPPPAPPVPRLTAATVIAVLVTLSGIVVLAAGGLLNLPGDLPLPLGVLLILFGGGLLFRRLRDNPYDDFDDGAIL